MATPFTDAARVTLGLLVRRRGPEDFPFDPALSWGLGVAAALTLVLEVREFPLQLSLLATLVGAGVQMLVIRGLLGFWLARRGLANRLPQTFGALMACTVVLNLLEWPLAVALKPVAQAVWAAERGEIDGDELARVMDGMPGWLQLPGLLSNLLIVWGVAVKTRLLERAFGFGFLRALWQLVVLLALASLLGVMASSFFMTPDDLRRLTPKPPATARAPAPTPTPAPAARPTTL